MTPTEVWNALESLAQKRGKEKLLARYPELKGKLDDAINKERLADLLRDPNLTLRTASKLTEAEKTDLKTLHDLLEETLAGTWFRLKTRPSVGLWTDDYSNLLSVFWW